ncbi:MAG: hypothetical protein P8P30_03070 [Rickettsiales bacterium]|nr:hypothetical protein [Rickettsiales bacterium]
MAGIFDNLKDMFASASDGLSDRNYGAVFDMVKDHKWIAAIAAGFTAGKISGVGGFVGAVGAVVGLFAVPKVFNFFAPKEKGAVDAPAAETSTVTVTDTGPTPEAKAAEAAKENKTAIDEAIKDTNIKGEETVSTESKIPNVPKEQTEKVAEL